MKTDPTNVIKTIKIVNNSHNTEVNLKPRDNKLSLRQIKRAKKRLCGADGCQYCNQIGIEEDQDGFRIELVTEDGTKDGAVKYGIVHDAPNVEKKMTSCFMSPYSLKMTYFDK